MNSQYQRPTRIRCNTCGVYTKHTVLYSHNREAVSDNSPRSTFELWRMLECNGCETITVQLIYADTPEIDAQAPSVYYPDRDADKRQARYFVGVPNGLKALYGQVMDARNGDLLLLAAGGLRTLLEGICEDKAITTGFNQYGKLVSTLEGRVNGLVALLPSRFVANLHGLRFLGNKALHDLYIPNAQAIDLALDTVEDLLYFVYDLEVSSGALLENVIPRNVRVRRDRAVAIAKAESILSSDPLFIEIETIGLPGNDMAELIGILIIDAKGNRIIDTPIALGRPMPIEVLELLGKTQADYDNACTFEQVYAKLLSNAEGRDLLSYGIDGDKTMLYQMAERHGQDTKALDRLRWHSVGDIFAIFHGDWNEEARRYNWQRSEEALRSTGITMPPESKWHRSSEATRLLLIHMASSS